MVSMMIAHKKSAMAFEVGRTLGFACKFSPHQRAVKVGSFARLRAPFPRSGSGGVLLLVAVQIVFSS